MEKTLNFSDLLRLQTHDNKHKIKPTQFTSIAGGVKKRLESTVKDKRKTRLTFFDNFRKLPLEPPAEVQLTKEEQRMIQLKKWKEERERKKQEQLKSKKKPFLVSTVKNPLTFEPPPSVRPSSSGRVTRSQTTRHNTKVAMNKQKKQDYKFAPKNAVFQPILTDLAVPPLIVFGEDKIAQKKQAKSQKSILKLEPKMLRSRTKNTDNEKITHTDNPGPSTCKTKPNTRKNSVINKPEKSKIVKSSSGEDESLAPKVKKMVTVKSPSSSYDSTENALDSRNLKVSLSRIDVSPKAIGKLVDLSNESSSIQTHVVTPKESILHTKMSPNKPNIVVEDLITFTPKNPIPKSESSSEEKLRSPKSEQSGLTPEQIALEVSFISPRVYLSRGKENNRKEMLQKIADGLLDDDYCDMGVHHFKNQLNAEIKRMTEMCETWDNIAEQTTLPEEIQDSVLAAVGQARLLMSQKMQQFASLVRRCELPDPGQALVTTSDLQGFWDMVFMQIDDVDIRFKKLEAARARGWVVEQPEPRPRAARPASRPAPRPVRPSRPAPNNHLRDVIAAARRAKKANTTDMKTFEAGFFSVQSPVKSPAANAPATLERAPATPISRPTLLKSVLSSEAKKASSKKSSLAMLRAASIGKQVDSDESPYEGNHTHLAPINLNATPGKSILKSKNNPTPKSTSKISFRLFKDMDIEKPENEEKTTLEVQKSRITDKSRNPAKLENVEKLELDISPKAATSEATDQLENLQISSPKEKIAEGKENRRKSRRKLGLESEGITPVMTRSRRKSLQTPLSENLDLSRSSRRKKVDRIEANEVKGAETPSITRSRRRRDV